MLDLWLFRTVTPKFMVVPGTEGIAGYKSRMFHARALTMALSWMFALAPVVALLGQWLPGPALQVHYQISMVSSPTVGTI